MSIWKRWIKSKPTDNRNTMHIMPSSQVSILHKIAVTNISLKHENPKIESVDEFKNYKKIIAATVLPTFRKIYPLYVFWASNVIQLSMVIKIDRRETFFWFIYKCEVNICTWLFKFSFWQFDDKLNYFLYTARARGHKGLGSMNKIPKQVDKITLFVNSTK